MITDKEREKLVELPLANTEINLSPYDVGMISVDRLIQLPQTRDEVDRNVGDLADSILGKKGLLSPVAVMPMTKEQFREHIERTNQIWGTQVMVEDYQQFKVDEHYHVVVAGHRRTDAIVEASLRVQEIISVPVHVYEYDPDMFISIQIDENDLRRETKPERQAKAIVETYRYGEALGKWSSASEFARASEGKLTPRLIRDAMCFINLPRTVRELVYIGALKYGVGVALGRAVPTIQQYYNFLSNGKIDDTVLARDVEQNVSGMAGHILNSRELRGVKMAQDYIRAQVLVLEEQMSNAEYEFSFISPDDQLKAYRKYIELKYREAWRAFASLPPARAIEILQQAGKITGEVYTEETRVLEDMQRVLAKVSFKSPSTIETALNKSEHSDFL